MQLTSSQRANVIREIARRLGKSDWSLVDMTLRQFGLPWTDDWSGDDPESYVMDMIVDATDTNLISLSQHLGYELSSSETPTDPSCWQAGLFRIFVSHLAAFRQFAGEIQQELLPYGMSSFVAHNDIEPTTEWQDEIELALATCDAMLVLLHPGFHESYWTDQEIGYAMGRRVMITSVRLGTDPYGFIGRFQALDGHGKTAKRLARELFGILRRHPMTCRGVSQGIVSCFAQSDSFETAKRNMALLEELVHWDASLSDHVRVALGENDQLYNAWGVPDRLAEFIERMEKES